MNNSLLFDSAKIDRSWKSFFTSSVINELILIEQKIGNDFTPTHDNVLNFARNDLNNVKVVILGQDPYPQIGAATGRAFEVNNLTSWNAEFRQASLRNILKLLYKTYHGELISYSQLKKDISDYNFKILPPDKLFKYWESQGVLLLNIYLTCKIGSPKSHRVLWKKLSRKVVEYISDNNTNIDWFLWGNEAKQFQSKIEAERIFICDHPMICSPNNKRNFMNSNCFEETKQIIDWLGYNQLN